MLINTKLLVGIYRGKRHFGALEIECEPIVFEEISTQDPGLLESRGFIYKIQIEGNRDDSLS